MEINMYESGTIFVNTEGTEFMLIQQVAGFDDKFVLQNLSTEGVFVMTKKQLDSNLTRVPNVLDMLNISITENSIMVGVSIPTHVIKLYEDGLVKLELNKNE